MGRELGGKASCNGWSHATSPAEAAPAFGSSFFPHPCDQRLEVSQVAHHNNSRRKCPVGSRARGPADVNERSAAETRCSVAWGRFGLGAFGTLWKSVPWLSSQRARSQLPCEPPGVWEIPTSPDVVPYLLPVMKNSTFSTDRPQQGDGVMFSA